jgi:alpha-D-ribose 1-methylphosphonate 5-triphosphate synthase subunit PhnI
MSDLLEQISVLLEAPTLDLKEIERTLTDGYAHALALEAERSRLERRVAALSRSIEGGDVVSKTHELADVARRLEAITCDLASLRRTLADLRRHAQDIRIGSPS